MSGRKMQHDLAVIKWLWQLDCEWWRFHFPSVCGPELVHGDPKYCSIWIKRDQLDVTCFFISLFTAQHVSDVNTSIFRCLRLICWVISWVVLLWYDVCWCYGVVWLGWFGIRMQAEACKRISHQHTSNQSNTTHEITLQISPKLLRMDVLTSETCWAVNNEIIKQVTSSWSLFIQLSRWCTAQ